MKLLVLSSLGFCLCAGLALAQQQGASAQVPATSTPATSTPATSTPAPSTPAPACGDTTPCPVNSGGSAVWVPPAQDRAASTALSARLYLQSHPVNPAAADRPAANGDHARCKSTTSANGTWSYTCSDDDELAARLQAESEKRVRELLK
jgi:hypothetical protein